MKISKNKIKHGVGEGIMHIEKALLLFIVAGTVWAAVYDIISMFTTQGRMDLADLFLLFIYAEILGMDQKEFSRHEFTNFKEQFHWFAWLALIFLILDLLVTDLHGTERNWQGNYIRE